MPPRSWSSTNIMISSHVYITFTLYHSFANATESKRWYFEVRQASRSGRVIVEAYL
jgi:hypothetical protein